MADETQVDCGPFSRQPRIVDAGAATGPARAPAAEQRRRERRRCRRVSDSHVAKADEVRLWWHGLIARPHRGEKCVLGHGRRLREVRRGMFERERNNMEVCADGSSNLVDRRTAGGEVRHHLGGYLDRIG